MCYTRPLKHDSLHAAYVDMEEETASCKAATCCNMGAARSRNKIDWE